MFLENVSYAHQDCIYLIKTTVILWGIISIKNKNKKKILNIF